MPRIERDRELAQRRKRKEKLKKLMERYLKANQADKATISAKIRRISPFYNIEERAAALAEKASPKKKK
jgi:hypothetical protein